MKKDFCVLLQLLVFLSNWGMAQEIKSDKKFTVDAEFRSRAEYLDGFGKLVAKSDSSAANLLISTRARLNFAFVSPLHEMYFSVQDVHIWDDNKHWETKLPVMVNEAWIRYKFNETWSLKTGRQQISYTNGRLLWKKEWNNYGAAHDALLFQYQQNNWMAQFGGAYNANPGLRQTPFLLATDFQLYKAMGILYVEKKWSSGSSLHLLNFAEGIEAPGRTALYLRNSAGFHFILKKGVFKVDAQFYHQHGVHTNGGQIMAAAYLLHGTIKLPKISLTAGFHGQTGESYNDNQADKRMKAFVSPYFSGRLMYGYMEYLAYGSIQKSPGLNDFYSEWNLLLNQSVKMQAITHTMSYAQSPGSNLSKSIGTESDLVLTKKLVGMHISLVYSFLLYHNDLALERTKNTDVYFPQCAWVMISFKPELFSQ